MQFTIRAVNPQTRSYSTKFGDMVSYKVLFDGNDTPVEISQKTTSPAPKVGDVVEGTIDMSAPYGPKFKKEYNQGGFGGSGSSQTAPRASGGSGAKGGFDSDPFTMYLSYAKDVAVALIASKDGFNEDRFAEILDQVDIGGKTLYGSRPGAIKDSEPTNNTEEAQTPVGDVIPTAEEVDNFMPEDIAKLFEK